VIPILAPLVCIPVMRGLDPIGAKLRSSLPGLTRQSIDLRKNFLAKKMDARVKPAHDELAKQLKLAPMGLDPRIHVFLTAAKSWMAGSNPRIKSGDGHDEF
jgi:hypothetical protein